MRKRIVTSVAAALLLAVLGWTGAGADDASPGRQYVVGVAGMH